MGIPAYRRVGKRPLTWPARLALAVALWAPIGWLLFSDNAERYPLLSRRALDWTWIFFGLYFTLVFARWKARDPKPCAPGDRSRRRLIVGALLLCLIPGFVVGAAVGWVYRPTLQTINGMFSMASDYNVWGFAHKYPDRILVTSPFFGSDTAHVLKLRTFADRPVEDGQLVRLTMRRGALGGLYVAAFEYEKVR